MILAVPYGLEAVARASLAFALCVALAGLWPIRREFGSIWPQALAGAAQPLVAAAAAGLILFALAEPVALALTPVPALCLLGALGGLCYLLLRGKPHGLRFPAFASWRWLDLANRPKSEHPVVANAPRLYLPASPLREPVAQPVEQLTFNQ